MAKERNSTFASVARKATKLKIIGWSAKYSATSLLECLASLGQVQGFTHYPQLTTSYATVRLSSKCKDYSKLLAERFPRAKVEILAQVQTLEAEKSIESTEKTAFISSRYLMPETALFRDLSQFGCLRSLNYYFSNFSQKWLCKASFYENYSLDHLLNNQVFVKRTFCGGIQIKLERFRGARASNLPKPNQESRGHELNIISHRNNQQISAGGQSQGSNRPEIIIKSQSLRRMQSRNMHRALSCDKSCQERLPVYNTFKNPGLCIENALKLHRSRRLEQTLQNKRSNSSGKRSDNQIKVQIASYADLSKSTRKQVVFTEYTFEENELLFLEISKSSTNTFKNVFSTTVHIDHKDACKTGFVGDQVSYLSLGEISDGYSATEEGHESQEIEVQTIKLIPSPIGSEKHASHILFTHCSSKLDPSRQVANVSQLNSPANSSVDHIFSSCSGPNSNNVPLLPYNFPWIAPTQTPNYLFDNCINPAF